MEDRDPVGVLDKNDLVAHQLGATPEIVSLGQLLKQRMKNHFDLLRVRRPGISPTLVFGGDVMLGRTCATKIENGFDPFAGIASILRRASFAAANLECTISNSGHATDHTRYAFRAPACSAQLLRRAGFHAMGLANNHALDFGSIALQESAAQLSSENIEPVGVATATGNPYTARLFSLSERCKLALLAISDVDTASGSEIAAASDRVRLNEAILRARSNASLVVCLVHWGIEQSDNISNEQRELARWLVDHGVDVVVGSHPHRVQPLDFYHGRPIAYSLGNLVFDGAPSVASWNRGALLEVGVNENMQPSSARLMPVVVQDGFPREDVAATDR
jgi:poly-gamma-glutamate synthesis protein (capsule biosynthesis protein)